ncbi:MAG: cupin domain-containing protein [Deltaproteobacteria bacterium]|nr:cupin domain-containing protein [Deltaproteobacteria bacterium]
MSTTQFFAEHWERSALHIRSQNRDRFAALMSTSQLDTMLTTLHPKHPEVSLIDASLRRETSQYAYESGLIDLLALFRFFDEGSTILWSSFELRHAALALLCRKLERELGHRTQTNVYFTPANSQGFRAHYDNHDVLVLQISGRKKWLLYDTPLHLPYPDELFDPETIKPGAISAEFVMEPGDVLYVPRGLMHDARAVDEESLHATVGIMARSWADAFEEVLSLAASRDPAFREALPPGFHRDGFDSREASAKYTTLLGALPNLVGFDELREVMADEILDARQAIVAGQRQQLRLARAIDEASTFAARVEPMLRVGTSESEVLVHVHGRTVGMPRHAESALRFALENHGYTLASLPGSLDLEGRKVLLRRLIREGLVTVLEGG